MRRLLAAALLSATPLAALAHDTWILPTPWRMTRPERLVVDLTSAMAFPVPETAVRADRLAASGFRVGGSVAPLEPLPASGKSLQLTATPSATGVATLWIATRPRTLDLKPDDVKHYLEEVGAWQTIGAQWSGSGGKTWRETYTKVAKAFVRVGEPQNDVSWSEPVGAALELVPASDPTRLVEGSDLTLRLLWNGRPVAGHAVGAVPASVTAATLRKTDATGQLAFRLDRSGPWLLRTTLIRPAAGRAGEWDSVFTTLTLDVLPRPAP